MSLANYTAVLGTPADWLHRADLTTAQADDFIDLFESDINSTLRVRQMEQSTSTVSTAGYLLHPQNWLQWKELRATYNGSTYDIEPVTDEIAVSRTYGEQSTSVPRYYKVFGDRTYLYPSASGVTVTGRYYEGVGLSSTSPGNVNWLLTRYPGAYLYGVLLQAVAYTGDDPRIPLWQAALEQTKANIRADSRKSEWSGQALKMNRDGDTP